MFWSGLSNTEWKTCPWRKGVNPCKAKAAEVGFKAGGWENIDTLLRPSLGEAITWAFCLLLVHHSRWHVAKAERRPLSWLSVKGNQDNALGGNRPWEGREVESSWAQKGFVLEEMDSALSFRGLFCEVSKHSRKGRCGLKRTGWLPHMKKCFRTLCQVPLMTPFVSEVCSHHFSGFPSVSAKVILVVKKVESEG